MDLDTQQKISKTVLAILKSSNMEETTEAKVRSMAAKQLNLDLSTPDRKKFVRQVVESFLVENVEEKEVEEKEVEEKEVVEEKEEENEKEEEGKKSGEKEYDDDGDLIICRLSNKRRVTIQEFKGKTLVSIREYYEKDGKQLPSSKGISLTAEQWEAFSKAVPKIEEAIKKLEDN